MWDPYQYARFSALRSRPFFDLLAQVQSCDPKTIVDLGCGSGELTRFFAKRWPAAHVIGVDGSPRMLEIAQHYAIRNRLEFVEHDLSDWEPETPVELVFSNAVLHWLPDHDTLIRRVAGMVSPKGTLAIQIPNNDQAPSHRIVRELATSNRWAPRLEDLARRRYVRAPDWYLRTLISLDFRVDVWETEYLQVLHGERPVLEWLKGTTIRPMLKRLEDDSARDAFLEELAPLLEEAYPPASFGTLYPFRRIFIVASRNPDCRKMMG